MAGLSAIKIKTILLDTFIELLVDEVNKLKNNEIKDILNDEIDVILPESEDIKSKTTQIRALRHFVVEIIAHLSENHHVFICGNSNN